MTVRIARIRISCGFSIAMGGMVGVETQNLSLSEARKRIKSRFATRTYAWSEPRSVISICSHVTRLKSDNCGLDSNWTSLLICVPWSKIGVLRTMATQSKHNAVSHSIITPRILRYCFWKNADWVISGILYYGTPSKKVVNCNILIDRSISLF